MDNCVATMKGNKNETAKKRANDKRSNFCVRECRSLSPEELKQRTPTYSHFGPVWDKSGRVHGPYGESSGVIGDDGQERDTKIANANNFRFWPTFTSEEEKSEWWASSTAKFRNWWATQSDLCGVYDGPTKGPHEDFRRARIKQLGNGIVPAIAEIIAERIKYHEFDELSQL